MSEPEHILISLEPRHAKSILDGLKSVELRRRAMHVSPGATVWLYAKQPVGSVVGKATIAKTYAASPSALWRKFSAVAGVSHEEFSRYFNGVTRGIALELTGAMRLTSAITLQELQGPDSRFHPPQFFLRLAANHPVRQAVDAAS